MLPCLISWFLSQAVKMIICSIKKEQKNMFASGGMPSAHTAVVLALVVRLFFTEGFGSPAFAVAFIYMIITMFDAANVRLMTGYQSIEINRLMRDLYKDKPEEIKELEVIKGHTYAEIVVGAAIGILVTVVYQIIEQSLLR
jgi:acid phosphatase family membrane protein YuiD